MAQRERGSSGPIIFSTSEDTYDLAVAELKEALGPRARFERWGPEVGTVTADGVSIQELARSCRDRPVVFVKHLSALIAHLDAGTRPDVRSVAETALTSIGRSPAALSVQAWVSGKNVLGFDSAETYAALAAEADRYGVSVARAGHDRVLSCCITPKGVLLGFNRAGASLSDWPGGRVRLARGPAQVSRAEFKLEEMFQTFAVRLPDRGVAVDLGAAPGGWTRILRQRNLTVLAVDPGDLDPRVAGDPGVRHLRTTAGEFLRAHRGPIDVVVNDMRMPPRLSSELMLEIGHLLVPGGLAVVTLKTGTGSQVLRTIKECLALLSSRYQLVGARQLHHNRNEVTVVLRRTPRRS